MCERPTSACRRPAARRLLLGWDAGAEQSSCWFLASKPPIELRGAGVAGCRDSIPAWFNRATHDEIETRGPGIRQGELQWAASSGIAQGRAELQRAAALDPGQVAPTPFPFALSAFHSIRALLSLPLCFFPRSRRKAGSSARAAVFPRAADFPPSIASARCALVTRGRLPRLWI